MPKNGGTQLRSTQGQNKAERNGGGVSPSLQQ